MNPERVKTLKSKLRKAYNELITAASFPAVLRVQVDTAQDYDPLSWLASQKEFPKFFWRSDDGGRVLAYTGTSCIHTSSDCKTADEHWASINQYLQSVPGLKCWFARSFHSRIKGQEWADFDAWSLCIPKFGLEREPVTAKWMLVCQLLVQGPDDPAVTSCLKALDEVYFYENLSVQTPDVLDRRDTPSYQQWESLVSEALREIKDGVLSKVVLARSVVLHFQDLLQPEQILQRLLTQRGSAFFLAGTPSSAFLGVSPELLFKRVRDRLDTFAIAGTRKRGAHTVEDQYLMEGLLSSAKDDREHKQVVETISGKLQTLCALARPTGKTEVLTLNNQIHLFQRFRGRILAGVTDEVVINTLHPTPAVGGVPSEFALRFLSDNDSFDRGLYSGNIGWLSRQETEIAVAIRSCLIKDDRCYIYGGAGILTGSDPLGEWEEIDLKMKNIFDVISSG